MGAEAQRCDYRVPFVSHDRVARGIGKASSATVNASDVNSFGWVRLSQLHRYEQTTLVSAAQHPTRPSQVQPRLGKGAAKVACFWLAFG
eukprot:3593021-Pleurochrysis_carterae.AAC.2